MFKPAPTPTQPYGYIAPKFSIPAHTPFKSDAAVWQKTIPVIG